MAHGSTASRDKKQLIGSPLQRFEPKTEKRKLYHGSVMPLLQCTSRQCAPNPYVLKGTLKQNHAETPTSVTPPALLGRAPFKRKIGLIADGPIFKPDCLGRNTIAISANWLGRVALAHASLN
eukprot:702937-Amphidinium_carterae.2